MLANALLWCSSNDLSARLSRLKPAGASLSVPSVFAALLGVMAAPLKGDPELKPLGRSLYDKYLGEMEVINQGIGTLLEEHWDARGRGIEERESPARHVGEPAANSPGRPGGERGKGGPLGEEVPEGQK